MPDWASWVAQTFDGRRQTFGKTYFRCAPCLTGSAYADYTASVIADGVAAIGFEGVHLDNSYYEHCWCPRCAEKFRQCLADRGDFEDVVGIPLTPHIQPPPLPLKGTVGLDPLQILWLQFGVNVRIEFFASLRQNLQTQHPALTVAGNPAFPRGDTAMISRCVDPSREAEAFFQQLMAELCLGTRKSFSDIAVYHDPLSATLGGDPEVGLNLALHQYLLSNGIPFQIVLPEQEIPASVRCLLVFHQGALSDGALEKLRHFAQQPNRCVWLAGHSAQNDECFVPRDRRDLGKLRTSPGIFHTAAFGDQWQKAYLHPLATVPVAESGYFAKKSLYLSGEDAHPFDEFIQNLPFQMTVKFSRPSHVLVHSQQTTDGRLLFHFRDQAGSGVDIRDVTIALGADFPTVSSWKVFSPNAAPSNLNLSTIEGSESILLPPFQHYALLVAQI